MSQMSGHQTSKTATVITAILGSFLILVDGLVILLEHAHLLHYLEAKFPVFYAILTSQTSTVVLPIVGILVLLWLILEQRQSRVHLSSAKQTPPPILKVPIARAAPRTNLKFLGARTVNLDYAHDYFF